MNAGTCAVLLFTVGLSLSYAVSVFFSFDLILALLECVVIRLVRFISGNCCLGIKRAHDMHVTVAKVGDHILLNACSFFNPVKEPSVFNVRLRKTGASSTNDAAQILCIYMYDLVLPHTALLLSR
jgi:hypothetical protein